MKVGKLTNFFSCRFIKTIFNLLKNICLQTDETMGDPKKAHRYTEICPNEDKLEKYIRHRLVRAVLFIVSANYYVSLNVSSSVYLTGNYKAKVIALASV